MGFSFKNLLKGAGKLALPVVGNALLPGVGGIIGGALASQIKMGGSGGKGGYDYNRELGRAMGGKDPLIETGKMGMDELTYLREQARNPRVAALENDPLAGVDYNGPDFVADKEWTRPSLDIQDDALGDYRNADFGDPSIAGDALDDVAGMGRDRSLYDKMDGYIGDLRRTAGAPITSQQLNVRDTPRVEFRDAVASEERASVDELMEFSPDAAFQQYTSGAKLGMEQALADSFKRLTASRAGGNRMSSGFFDIEAGEVGRAINNDFTSQMLQRALDTTALRQQGITDATQIRASDIAALREGRNAVSMSNSRMSLDASNANAEMNLRARLANQDADLRAQELTQRGALGAADASARMFGLMLQDRDSRGNLLTKTADMQRGDRDFRYKAFSDKADRALDVAKIQRDDRDAGQSAFESDRAYGANRTDARNRFNMDRWTSSTDARFKGAEMVRGDRSFVQGVGERAQERYMDWLSGQQDRLMGARNATEQRRQNSADRSASLWGTVATVGGNLLSGYLRNKTGGSSGGAGRPASDYSSSPYPGSSTANRPWDRG